VRPVRGTCKFSALAMGTDFENARLDRRSAHPAAWTPRRGAPAAPEARDPRTVAFWTIATYTLAAAYFVVSARNLFRCAVGLAAVLIGIAGLYLIMDAQSSRRCRSPSTSAASSCWSCSRSSWSEDVTQKEFLRSRLSRCILAAVVAEVLLAIVCGALLAQGFGPTGRAPPPRRSGDRRALLSTGPGGFVLPSR